MTNQAINLISEYNTKTMLAMRAMGDLNVAAAELFVNKQVELGTSLLDTGLASSKELAAVKTPAEAMEISSNFIKTLTATMTGFFEESKVNAEKAGEDMKVAINDAVKLNSELAGKAMETGIETFKKTAKKAA